MNPEKNLHLIRHGQTDWNVERRVMGDLGIDINDLGVNQIQESSKYLISTGLDHIYSSPLKRAVSSAKILCRELGANLTIDPRLSELKFGHWQGMNISELMEDSTYHQWRAHPAKFTLPGGETLGDVRKRCMEAVDEILSQETGTHLAIVSHSDVIRVILANFMGLPLDMIFKITIDNASISSIRIAGDTSCVLTINSTNQLQTKTNV